jgi:RNA polymerase sigma-70 factor, ECF subfamily
MNDTIANVVERVFREEHGRLLASLISHFGDFSLAEDALQDALIVALEKWAQEGVPRNPGAWITTIAKRRAIDRLRRTSKHTPLSADFPQTDTSKEGDDEMVSIPDERLKLMFTCCHPSLSPESQVALTLRTLGGLTTDEIAKAFLLNPVAMAQRLTRAKAKIRDAGIPYRIPPVHLLPERLDALLNVLYLIFNEGYCALREDALVRRELCQEAILLCRGLLDLLPNTPLRAEPQGLLALMLLHDARREARVNADGQLMVLEEQDRTLWHTAQISEGIQLLEGALAWRRIGTYQLQAAISAIHAEATHYDHTDWAQIAELYATLVTIAPSPVVEVNRAVAIGMAQGATLGLRWLLRQQDLMNDYYPYHATRADLLRRSHQIEAACEAYDRAIALCHNGLERAFLHRRRQSLQSC